MNTGSGGPWPEQHIKAPGSQADGGEASDNPPPAVRGSHLTEIQLRLHLFLGPDVHQLPLFQGPGGRHTIAGGGVLSRLWDYIELKEPCRLVEWGIARAQYGNY